MHMDIYNRHQQGVKTMLNYATFLNQSGEPDKALIVFSALSANQLVMPAAAIGMGLAQIYSKQYQECIKSMESLLQGGAGDSQERDMMQAMIALALIKQGMLGRGEQCLSLVKNEQLAEAIMEEVQQEAKNA